jgi:MFS family permease
MLYLFLSSSIAIFGFSATNLFTVIFATTVLQIDKFAWAMLIAVLPVTTILLALPVGKLVDKFRRKIPLLAVIFLFGLSMWIFIDGYTLPQVAASLILIGAGQVMINASIGALQTDLTPKELRGKIKGFMNFSNCIIMAIASILGGYLYEHVAPQAPFMLAAIMALPSFAAVLLLVKEPKTREE